eukprot:scaffold67911_cov63-Phaeocystis_antarctica.AAC.3
MKYMQQQTPGDKRKREEDPNVRRRAADQPRPAGTHARSSRPGAVLRAQDSVAAAGRLRRRAPRHLGRAVGASRAAARLHPVALPGLRERGHELGVVAADQGGCAAG